MGNAPVATTEKLAACLICTYWFSGAVVITGASAPKEIAGELTAQRIRTRVRVMCELGNPECMVVMRADEKVLEEGAGTTGHGSWLAGP
jgi:hypothetical protein